MKSGLNSFEVCAGAGGQARGLELAGFEHRGVLEIDSDCCKTLRLNRPDWDVREADLNDFDARAFKGVELFAGGLPCPPFSVAGKQLGAADERNLFPAALRIIDQINPKAVMIENVKGFLSPIFADYREILRKQFKKLGYQVDWRLLNACDFGVPQLRPRVVIVALKQEHASSFEWPQVQGIKPPTVGETLLDLMAEKKWIGAKAWAKRANGIAPTLVGGSKKHGGPDLGPTRARQAWAALGVNGKSIAEEAPEREFVGMPRLTVRMAARVQGFDDTWEFSGRKTAAYRQVGNAFPPPVAQAVAESIATTIQKRKTRPARSIA